MIVVDVNAEDLGLCSPAVFGFLRIVTNPRVLISPVPVDAATRYVSEWLDRPNVRFLVPGPRHLDIAFELLHGVGTAGNLTTHIQLAAFALENDAEMFSNDSDFGRFPRTSVEQPAQLSGRLTTQPGLLPAVRSAHGL